MDEIVLKPIGSAEKRRDSKGLWREKTYADHAAFIHPLARAVIEINENCEVIKSYVREEDGWSANYLVIVRRIWTDRGIDEVIRLEIGFKRSVPYMPFVKKGGSRGSKLTQTTRRYIPLSEREILKLLPEIAKVIQEVIDGQVRSWKNGITSVRHKRSKQNGGKTLLKGPRVTISEKDSFILYAFLLRVMQGRETFLRDLCRDITFVWRKMKKSKYTSKQLRSYKNINKIVDKVNHGYTEEQLSKIVTFFGNSKEGVIFADVLEIFRNKLVLREKGNYEKKIDALHSVFSDYESIIMKCFSLSVGINWKEEDKRSTHAIGCFRLVVHPSPQLQLELEAAHSEFVSNKTKSSENESINNEAGTNEQTLEPEPYQAEW